MHARRLFLRIIQFERSECQLIYFDKFISLLDLRIFNRTGSQFKQTN